MSPPTKFAPLRLPSPVPIPIALVLLATVALVGCAKDKQTSTVPLAPESAHVTELSPDLAASGNTMLATTLGGPLAGLTPAELARFEAVQEDFEDVETVEDGLGPVFNDASCFTCHNAPIGGTNGRLETRFGKSYGGQFDPLARLGGSLRQDH